MVLLLQCMHSEKAKAAVEVVAAIMMVTMETTATVQVNIKYPTPTKIATNLTPLLYQSVTTELHQLPGILQFNMMIPLKT